MNPSQVALIVAIAVTPPTSMGILFAVLNYRLARSGLDRMADRVRVVNPAREQQQEQKEPARVPDLTARRPA